MINGKKVIAVCITKIGDGGSFEYIDALYSFFQKAGFYMMVYHTCSDFFWNTPNEAGEKAVFELIDYDITDAVVIISSTFKSSKPVEEIVKNAKAHGKLVISIDGLIKDCVCVLPDYVACFEELVRHMVEYHGIRDVGFISGIKGNPFAEERLDVYKKVLRENDIDPDTTPIEYGDFWTTPTVEAVQKLIRENRVPKALICANDSMAITACTELQKNGYRIPEDVRVTGLDGILEGRYFTPRLTSCDSNYEKVGERVTCLLQDMLAGEPVEETYKIPFKVHLGESCGCEPEEDIQIGSEMLALNDSLYYYRTMDRAFYEASAEILACDSAEKITGILSKTMPDRVICLVNEDFLKKESAFDAEDAECSYDENMYVLYDSGESGKSLVNTYVKREGLLPDLEGLLEEGNPLVFTAVCFRNRSIGYICTYFGVKQHDYLSISQCAIGVSNALGGFQNIQYQRYLNGQIEKIYAYDSLTGLLNRQGFYKYCQTMLEEMGLEGGGELLLLSADLDGLKHINDCYGHLEGDNAIAVAAHALDNAYPEKKICFRFGGDEMIALIPVYGEKDMEQKVRASVNAYLANYNKTSGKPYEISISMGFFMESVEDFALENLIKKADINMYTEKKRKKAERK